MKLARIHRDEVGSKSIMTFCRIVLIMKLLILFVVVADSMSFCRGVCRCTKNSAGADDQILMCRVNSRDCGPAFYYPGIGGQCNETRPGRITQNSTGLPWLTAYRLCHIRNGRCNSTQTAHSSPHRARWLMHRAGGRDHSLLDETACAVVRR